MREKIVTVTGRIAPGELGFCQCHEHILLKKGQSYQVNRALWFDEPEKSKRELELYREAGGRAVVDAQPVGCGRMARELQKLSEETGVLIVASTGFHKMIFYPKDHWIFHWNREALRDLYISELTDGMYADGEEKEPALQLSSCLAGQIKTAYDTEGLTDQYQKLFLAAADAAKATHAPMMIHVENGTDPRPLLAFLQKEEVPASQLIFCHMDRACENLEWHKEIARSGAYLEYDTIGRFKYHSDKRELEIMGEMLEAGYEDQLLFSLDTTRERLGAYGGSITLNYILEIFIPEMKQFGIGDKTIQKIAVENSAAAMAWKN